MLWPCDDAVHMDSLACDIPGPAGDLVGQACDCTSSHQSQCVCNTRTMFLNALTSADSGRFLVDVVMGARLRRHGEATCHLKHTEEDGKT